ncbi:hypothetical protein [Piscirickettsia salmonis]|uniref:hypothetical protein n=1 Tax=Piscirickettsia salmonis TaxID=1238 RepID=UPI0007D7D172|nr:hypothetical protein A0O36_00398 [Piscirickettsiaceae bacterium NZ-RLO1]
MPQRLSDKSKKISCDSGDGVTGEIRALINSLKVIDPKFMSGLTSAEHGRVLKDWQQVLDDIPRELIKAAVSVVRKSEATFMLKAGQFRALCLKLEPEGLNLGFKSIHDAYLEAYHHMYYAKPDKEVRWSHATVYKAACESINRNGTAQCSERELFAKRYRQAIIDFLNGEQLPEPPVVRRVIEHKSQRSQGAALSALAKMRQSLRVH